MRLCFCICSVSPSPPLRRSLFSMSCGCSWIDELTPMLRCRHLGSFFCLWHEFFVYFFQNSFGFPNFVANPHIIDFPSFTCFLCTISHDDKLKNKINNFFRKFVRIFKSMIFYHHDPEKFAGWAGEFFGMAEFFWEAKSEKCVTVVSQYILLLPSPLSLFSLASPLSL